MYNSFINKQPWDNMSKKLITAEVLQTMINLPLEAVKGAIESGGGSVKGGHWDDGTRVCYEITGAKFLGMQSSGAFVYAVEGQKEDGEPLPDHIAKFKIGVEFNPKFLGGIKEEYRAHYSRQKIGDYRVYWK